MRTAQQASVATGPRVRVPVAAGDGAGHAVVRPLTGTEEAAAQESAELATQPWITAMLRTAVVALPGAEPDLETLRGLTVGDRNSLLLGVILATYGPRLTWQLDCSCGESLHVEVDLRELLRRADADSGDAAALLPGARLPTGADLEAVAQAADVDAAWAELVARCAGDLPEGPDGLELVESRMAAADPLADIALRPTCWQCHAVVSLSLDPAVELAARLASWADLLYDVHALARAYGWSEPDVLALPRPRRADYLLLIADVGE